MTERLHARAALLASLAASALALAGCMGSPTYGTDKTASEQLVGDLSGALSLAPPKREAISYNPRPDLVKPQAGAKGSLPVPQDRITETASNMWPESPEQKRARLRAEADAHFNDTNFQAQIVDDMPKPSTTGKYKTPQLGHDRSPAWTPEDSGKGTAARRAEIAKRLQEQNQGDPARRKYLSEPPLDYRVAASTAPQNDIGEDEYKKERRLKKEAAKGKSGWFDWW
jgi:hypothetical protein